MLSSYRRLVNSVDWERLDTNSSQFTSPVWQLESSDREVWTEEGSMTLGSSMPRVLLKLESADRSDLYALSADLFQTVSESPEHATAVAPILMELLRLRPELARLRPMGRLIEHLASTGAYLTATVDAVRSDAMREDLAQAPDVFLAILKDERRDSRAQRAAFAIIAEVAPGNPIAIRSLLDIVDSKGTALNLSSLEVIHRIVGRGRTGPGPLRGFYGGSVATVCRANSGWRCS